MPIACALSSAEEATYFFSTASFAAAVGFSSTHRAPLSKARVTFAAPAGSLDANLPLTTVAQQYSSLYGASTAWSAIVRTPDLAVRIEPSGSESATASTCPLSSARPMTSGATTTQATSFRGSSPFAASTRLAKRNGGLPIVGMPIFFPLRSSGDLMSDFAPTCTRRHPEWTPPVIFTSRPCSIGFNRYMISV